MDYYTKAHRELVIFANQVAAHEELGERAFGVKLLAELWRDAGLELTQAG